ncbi:MAG: PKD domain-containing protein [Nitrospirae bacterium]|nr:PKD domain-containing protein [Nitrospirota bacterium]
MTNFNGSPLTDINGYKLYYGSISRKYTQVINVGKDTTYEVNNLTEGSTYYFTVTAYDTSGNESVYSNEVSKLVLPLNKPPVANAGGIYSNAEGQVILLNGSGSVDPDGSIVRYEWDVNGDGIYDYSDAPATRSHTYSRQGVYTIKFRVTDNLGATSEAVAKAYISDTLPTASFTGSSVSGTAPLIVTFSNTSSGYDNPLTYAWDFDNNGTIDSTGKDPSYTYATPGIYTVKLSTKDSDGSINTFTRTNYITANYLYALDCPDGGNIACMRRTDGGSDSDNLVDGKPKADVEYEFQIRIKDTSGRTPLYVKLYMTQRNNPTNDSFYSYTMSCSGSYNSGGLCTYITKLGPAAVHKYYFSAQFFDGTIRRYPNTGYITGPQVQLLNGYNTVGIPRNIGTNILDGYTAFWSTSVYRWNVEGYYTAVTATKPVRQGEGYKIQKQVNTLPEHAGYADILDAETTIELKPGWNIISNPYSGNVDLSVVKVRKGTSTVVNWTEAASNGWIENAISYRSGTDWGYVLLSESPPKAKLVPWMGYWIYLNMKDATYYLLIPRPQRN